MNCEMLFRVTGYFHQLHSCLTDAIFYLLSPSIKKTPLMLISHMNYYNDNIQCFTLQRAIQLPSTQQWTEKKTSAVKPTGRQVRFCSCHTCRVLNLTWSHLTQCWLWLIAVRVQIHYFTICSFTLTLVCSEWRCCSLFISEKRWRRELRRGFHQDEQQERYSCCRQPHQPARLTSLSHFSSKLLLFSQFWLKSQNSGKIISLRITFSPWNPTRVLTLFHNSYCFPRIQIFPWIIILSDNSDFFFSYLFVCSERPAETDVIYSSVSCSVTPPRQSEQWRRAAASLLINSIPTWIQSYVQGS